MYEDHDCDSIEIDCDGTWCLKTNSIVYPERIGDGDTFVGILGEAPYVDEERMGRPFVGASGQIIRGYLDLTNFTYFIFNTLSCLTYDNGRPLKPSKMGVEEFENRFAMCRPNRDIIFDLLEDGSVIVALGKFAIYTMFEDWDKKASLYPDFVEYDGKTFVVYCLYHPAYLLYRPSARKDFEEMLRATGVFKLSSDEE